MALASTEHGTRTTSTYWMEANSMIAAAAVASALCPPSMRLPNSKLSIATMGPIMESVQDRKSTSLNSSHLVNSYAVFCFKKKKIIGPNDIHNSRLTFASIDAIGNHHDTVGFAAGFV